MWNGPKKFTRAIYPTSPSAGGFQNFPETAAVQRPTKGGHERQRPALRPQPRAAWLGLVSSLATPLPVPPRGSHVGRQAAGRGIFLPGSRGAGWGGTPHFRTVPWERLVYQHGEARAGPSPLVHSPNVPSGQARLGLKPELNPGLPHEWSGPKLAGRRRPPKVRT